MWNHFSDPLQLNSSRGGSNPEFKKNMASSIYRTNNSRPLMLVGVVLWSVDTTVGLSVTKDTDVASRAVGLTVGVSAKVFETSNNFTHVYARIPGALRHEPQNHLAWWHK